jgi:hypothetical protein
MPLVRQVLRELLDELPADDPRAVRSRRDLVRVNEWMLQPAIMARMLRSHSSIAPRTILDLGGGDAKFMLRVASLLAPTWRGVTLILLDRQNIASHDTLDSFAALGWTVQTVTADLFDDIAWTKLSSVDIVTANLFLHHLTQQQLSRLFSRTASLAPLFVACEPRRALLGLLASRLLWVIGCNSTTRHDAVVSVQAGFREEELSALWPKHAPQNLQEYAAGLFTHCFVAYRLHQGSLRET